MVGFEDQVGIVPPPVICVRGGSSDDDKRNLQPRIDMDLFRKIGKSHWNVRRRRSVLVVC